VCELVYRPLAHLVVLALLPLRIAPPAVVLAGAVAGIAAAVEIVRGGLLLAAGLVVVKTILDGADGALARAAGRVSAFGRYLDSDCDLVVNAALWAAIGYSTGRPLLAAAAFAASTLVLSVNFNLRRLYSGTEAMPEGGGAARRFHNLGLATQHTALAVCLVLVAAYT
jgi:archaetidylinositol phosphate synthase